MNETERRILERVPKWFSNYLAVIPMWDEDKGFKAVYDKAARIRGNHITRCFTLYNFIKNTNHLDGEVAEVGVFNGRTSKLIALCTDKIVHAFDTFEGIPQHDPTKDPRWVKGSLKADYEGVKKFLSDCPNVKIYKGVFPSSGKPIEDKKFSFVHIDVDIYQSVKDCSEFFYSRMVKGGVIVYDDPGFNDCRGAKLALDEFYSEKPEFPMFMITGQVVVIKW